MHATSVKYALRPLVNWAIPAMTRTGRTKRVQTTLTQELYASFIHTVRGRVFWSITAVMDFEEVNQCSYGLHVFDIKRGAFMKQFQMFNNKTILIYRPCAFEKSGTLALNADEQKAPFQGSTHGVAEVIRY